MKWGIKLASHYLRKYATATTVNFELYKLDGTGLKVDAASASGDITLYRDEGSVETLDADAFVDEGTIYSLAISQAEMTAARIIIAIVDQSSPQVWLDKVLIIETYGNASAQHIFDLGTATVNLSSTSETQIDNIETAATTIKKVNINKWAIVANQLIIYDDNKVDVLYTFNLDSAVAPTSRTPV
jgi:hypothetical protein